MEQKGGRSIRQIVKRIDKDYAQPIMYLQRDKVGPQGQAVGTITTSPKEIDAIVRRAWDAIYQGSKADNDKAAGSFMAKYSQRVFKDQRFDLQPITAERVNNVCRRVPHTAGGMNGWDPADLSILSDLAYDIIARMLSAIVDGAPWQRATRYERATFLAK